MTTNNTENAGGVTITEADRKAACTEFARRFGGTVSQHLAVLDDAHPLTQAFAKHRIAARQAALEETGWRLLADQEPPKDAVFATAYFSHGRWLYDYAEWSEEYQEYCNWGCGFDYVTHWAHVTPPETTPPATNTEG